MKEFSKPSEIKSYLKAYESIGFVPTLGGIHEGHLSLLRESQKENQITVASVFLNSTQFNNPQDLKNYPAHLEEDKALLEKENVDILFVPSFSDIYPDEFNYRVQETDLSQHLCGTNRPGHFTGVLTVVMKLLNIIQPTRAYFGEKDYQQLLLVRGMVEAFFMDTQIIGVATVREDSGLALSSRNRKLDNQGISKAQLFAKALKQTQPLEDIRCQLEAEDIQIDYLEERMGRRFGAVQIDGVRLIDNVSL